MPNHVVFPSMTYPLGDGRVLVLNGKLKTAAGRGWTKVLSMLRPSAVRANLVKFARQSTRAISSMTTSETGLIFQTDWLSRIVLFTLLGFGTLLVFLVPPIQSPDEDSHFTRVVMLSQGEIFPVQRGSSWGQLVPASLTQYVADHKTLAGKAAARYSYQKWILDAASRQTLEPRVFHIYSGQSISPLSYIPQLSGLFFGKIIYSIMPVSGQFYNWSAKLYFSRLGNLFFFAVLSALAIGSLARGRAFAAGIVLLPMTVHLAASSSYDTTPLLAALWLVTVVVRILDRGAPPLRRDIILLALLAFTLGHAKVVYAPLLLIIVALKRDMPWRDFIWLCLGLFLVCLAGAVSGAALFGLPASEALRAASSAQANYVLGHLWEVPLLVARTLYASAEFYFVSFLGNLGWLDTNFPLPALALLFSLLILALVHDALQGPPPLGWVGLLGAVAGAALAVTGVMLSMYFYWTSHTRGIGVALVDGVQGRYFIPIVLVSVAACAGLPVRLSRIVPSALRDLILPVQIAGQTTILVLMVFVILIRYWVPF